MTAPQLNVKVNFVLHIDERLAPRKLQVSCPAGTTVQDLIEILSDKYGDGMRSSLSDPNLMAIINGISQGKRCRAAKLDQTGETEIDVWFMLFLDHGG